MWLCHGNPHKRVLENPHNTDFRQSYQYTGVLLYVSHQLLASRAHVAMAGYIA